MNILFLPNWSVKKSNINIPNIQSPDKYIQGDKYWFFKSFPEDTEVDIIDIQANNILNTIERKIKFYIWQAFIAYKTQKKYDIIISHGAQSGLVLSLLRTLTFCKSPKHIIFDIGGMNGDRNNIFEITAIKIALLSNPYIICHSKVIIDNYKKHFKSLVSRTKFIPFGVNTQEFCPKENISEKEQILAFGYAKRDYHTLIEAFKKIEHPNITLKIIGIPYPKEAKGCKNIVITKKISIEDLKNEIQSSKFIIIPLPFYNYSYGQMSFLQSMSLGKAVIVTKTPSSIDYFQDGYGMITVEPYNIIDMKNKIEMLLNNEAFRKEITAKARPYVKENFSEEIMGKRIGNYVCSILKETKN